MTAQRVFSCMLVLVGLASSGCAAETTDDDMVGQDINVSLDSMGGPGDPTDNPPGSGNGWEPACGTSAESIAAIQKYGVQVLWNSPMGTDYGTLPPNPNMDAIAQPCRSKILKYLIRCALPKDTYVIDPNDGERYWGWLDITTQWRTTPLSSTPDDQWWLTACLYQHLNGFGVEVPILLDGNKPGLYTPTQNHPEFVKRDSRIWGNLFTAVGDFVPDVCYETDLLNSCKAATVIDTRLCDSDPTLNCNVNIIGACSSVCTTDKFGQIACGASGTKNIGSRLKEFGSYGAMCVP